jgi:hypothetical protein
MCNNSPLQIRTNLYDALDRINDNIAFPMRPLWVDAICLNQVDEDEKAHQIPQMGRIYESASRTLIWLGNEADDSSYVLNWMNIYYRYIRDGNLDRARKLNVAFTRHYAEHDQIAITYEALEEQLHEYPELADRSLGRFVSKRYEQCRFAGRIMDAIPALLSRPWFERVWTMQELYLSHTRLVICGPATIDWTAFTQCLVHPTCGLEVVFLTRAFQQERSRIWTVYEDAIVTIDNDSETGLSLDDKSPHIYMRIIESKKCMEPVDRVWGIVSLFHRWLRQRIWDANIIDYTMLGRQQNWKTYLSFMQVLFQHNPLDFWFMILRCQGLPKHICLPSWCPDFNGLRRYTSLNYLTPAPVGQQAIHAGIKAKEILNLEAFIVMVQGFTIDAVRNSTMPAPLRESHVREEIPEDFLQQVFSLVSEVDMPGESRHITDDMCQTLYFEPSPEDNDDPDRHRKHYEKLVNAYRAWSQNRNSLADPEVLQGISLGRKSEGRSFFNTINGRLGFGPPETRAGDLICVFNITQQVFVLQAVDVKTLQNGNIHSMSNLAKHSEFFHLIGDTYLSGCMHGAAFTAAGRGSDRIFVLA